MTGLAILADLLPVLGHMLVGVTPETSWSIDVADVVDVGPERHLHVRKDAATIDVLRRKDGPADLGVSAGRRLSLVEIAERARNRVDRRLLRRIALLERLHRFATDERQHHRDLTA